MIEAIDNKLIRAYWLDKLIWAATSVTVVSVIFLYCVAHFGLNTPYTWVMTIICAFCQVAANVFMTKYKFAASLLLFLSPLIIVNVIGPYSAEETGLLQLYSFLAIASVISRLKKLELVVILTLGFASFGFYLFIQAPSASGILS